LSTPVAVLVRYLSLVYNTKGIMKVKYILLLCLVFAVVNVLCETISKDEVVKHLKKAYRLKSDQDAEAFYEALKLQLDLWNKSMASNDDKFKVVSPGFPCQPYGPSPQKPTSVHNLRPGDIDVVMAMGDSLTAAFGADAWTVFTVFTEYRGLSWSIGGDSTVNDVFTIPNILKKYNPNIKGFSIKTGDQNSGNSRLNVAVTGAIAQDMLGQAQELVKRLKSDPAYDIQNSWKMLTIFIGANNLCDVCEDPNKHGPSAFATSIEQALDYLKANVPRLYINLVPTVDVTELGKVTSFLCNVLHPFECYCAVSSDQKHVQLTTETAKNFGLKLYEIAAKAKYNDRDDFTIVIQPFFTDVTVPTEPDGSPDFSYFAPDCFHFSTKGHAASAVGLWNNIVEKVGDKSPYWRAGTPVKCPALNSVLPTDKNSGVKTSV
jgi:phospholipase B1